MKILSALRTRREFLRGSLLGGAMAYTVPAFLANTFSALQAEAADSGTQTVTGKDAPILVVLQLAGGNDGLNTVIPFQNDFYRQARPRLRIAPAKVLKLNEDIGLHPALSGLKSLYDAGHLGIVQGVGYPNPNRSHFRSTEIWQTASDGVKFEKYGWLGRYFDNACKGADPMIGVSIGGQAPQSFVGKHPAGITLQRPENYRFMSGGPIHPGELTSDERSFRELNGMDAHESERAPVNNSGETINSINGPVIAHGSPLEFLERTALDAEVSSDRILEVTRRVATEGNYPASQLGNSLRLAAKLIGGGLPTRVYYVSQGGYDTHTNQTGAQDRLLLELGDSIKAFVADMKAQGNFSRVLLMTFSEFGRRVAENANGGTDHGAAAPLFIVRSDARQRLFGKYPSLAPADLFEGDLAYNVDFRAVYAGILDGWLKTDSSAVLGSRFQPPPGFLS